MHGIIHSQLQKFVVTHHGKDVWRALLKEAGLAHKSFLVSQAYPDEDVLSLVSTASRMTGVAANDVLEAFGEFLTPDLIGIYGQLVRPEWRTLDLLEHTEATIHHVVRIRNPGAHPPALQCSRQSPKDVVITYSSPRRMCAVARGIVRGVAKHYQESVTITEPECMHAGCPACKISVSLVA